MSTREFEVVYIGTVREVYYVEAESEEEARRIWSDVEPLSSHVMEGDVESVRDLEGEA
ncbi:MULTISPECIES: hypothetical protein [unclassified Luteococcus]|uniref:hypothetical protein n=1 Tax=unclassified Luteococcus TaxID=2639923 RepID=UPI00313EE49F